MAQKTTIDLQTLEQISNEDVMHAIMLLAETSNLPMPLPSPDMLKSYSAIEIDGKNVADVILAEALKQAEHLRECDKKAQLHERLLIRIFGRGQIFGFVLGLAGLGLATLLALLGHDTIAGIFGTTTIVGLVAIFVIGKKKSAAEAANKDGAS